MGGVGRQLATPAVVLLLAICAAQVSESLSSAHSCFVCVPRHGSTSADMRRLFPGNILHCEDLQVEDPAFIRECPSKSVGCQTQTNGMQITRTCSDVSLNTCSTANNIKYCYCTGTLCNRPSAMPSPISSPTDDEDLTVEGSGNGHQKDPIQTRTPPTTVAVGPGTTSSTLAKTSDASRHGVATLVLLVGSVLALVVWQ